jgi:hypothetical protein
MNYMEKVNRRAEVLSCLLQAYPMAVAKAIAYVSLRGNGRMILCGVENENPGAMETVKAGFPRLLTLLRALPEFAHVSKAMAFEYDPVEGIKRKELWHRSPTSFCRSTSLYPGIYETEPSRFQKEYVLLVQGGRAYPIRSVDIAVGCAYLGMGDYTVASKQADVFHRYGCHERTISDLMPYRRTYFRYRVNAKGGSLERLSLMPAERTVGLFGFNNSEGRSFGISASTYLLHRRDALECCESDGITP